MCILSVEADQKRLTAFERAGVENYLYKRRREDDNKIHQKAEHIEHRYRRLSHNLISRVIMVLLFGEPYATSLNNSI